MNKECLELIRDVGKYDFLVGTIITILLFILFKGGAGLFIIGMLCSFVNFVINSYANNGLRDTENIFNIILFVASYVVRIGLICSVGIFLILKNDLFFYFFIAGYSAQFISILMYGVKLKTKEGI